MKQRFIIFIILILKTSTVFSQAAVKTNFLSPKEVKDGWVLLFDGRTSTGWVSADNNSFPGIWKIANGCLSVNDSAKVHGGSDIVTVKSYANFDFVADYLIVPGCNSGIKYFFTTYKEGGNLGMEYQILDDVLASDNKLANHLCGSLYDIFPADVNKKVNPPGQWNHIRIVSIGKHVEHWLNGFKILEFERGSEAYLSAVAKSKYKTNPVFGMVERGRILLQDHGGMVSFRNIKIKEMSAL